MESSQDFDGNFKIIVEKALYGLVESGTLWLHMIREKLYESAGVRHAVLDPYLLYCLEGMAGLVVDDLIIVGTDDFHQTI